MATNDTKRDWTRFCPCGRALHYRDATMASMMQTMVRNLGPLVLVSTSSGTWRVPRHYIALHGLKAADLPNLGFEKVGTDERDA